MRYCLLLKGFNAGFDSMGQSRSISTSRRIGQLLGLPPRCSAPRAASTCSSSHVCLLVSLTSSFYTSSLSSNVSPLISHSHRPVDACIPYMMSICGEEFLCRLAWEYLLTLQPEDCPGGGCVRRRRPTAECAGCQIVPKQLCREVIQVRYISSFWT